MAEADFKNQRNSNESGIFDDIILDSIMLIVLFVCGCVCVRFAFCLIFRFGGFTFCLLFCCVLTFG